MKELIKPKKSENNHQKALSFSEDVDCGGVGSFCNKVCGCSQRDSSRNNSTFIDDEIMF